MGANDQLGDDEERAVEWARHLRDVNEVLEGDLRRARERVGYLRWRLGGMEVRDWAGGRGW